MRPIRRTLPAILQPSSGPSSASSSRTSTSTFSSTTTTESRTRPPEPGVPSTLIFPYEDSRRQYGGYPFVFGTDEAHDTVNIFPEGWATSGARYLRPFQRQVQIDSLPPTTVPFFFVSFHWDEGDGIPRTVSRVKLCNAWQLAFNRLVYYVSFLEEKISGLRASEVGWLVEQFGEWNSMFCELDTAISLLVKCQRTRSIPTFKYKAPLPELDFRSDDSPDRTRKNNPLDEIPTTFLQVALEVNRRDVQEHPPDEAKEIESRLAPWQPCPGHQVVQATGWNTDTDGHET